MIGDLLIRAGHRFHHEVIKRDRVYKWRCFLEKSQWWKRERLEEHQARLLAKLLVHAREKVPYYREILSGMTLTPVSVRDSKVWRRIPFISKEIIRKNFVELQAFEFPRSRFIPNATSGSTGINLKFFSDRASMPQRQGVQFRIDDWMGMYLGSRELTIWGINWDSKRTREALSILKRILRRKLLVSQYQLTEDNMRVIYEQMVRFKAEFLHGYPSTLYYFSQYLKKKRLSFPLRAIRCAGETLYPYQRMAIEEVFGARIFNYYSSREVSGIAQEDVAHDGLYVQAENVFLEVLDESGDPVFDQEGEIVVTDLHNFAMPFIRYRIGDRGILSSSPGNSERGLPLLKAVTGRTFDLITFPNGNTVGGTFWTLMLKSEKGIFRFQVNQKSVDLIQIKYCPDEELEMDTIQKITNRIRQYAGDELKIEFEHVESIPTTQSGKFRYVVSEINKP